MIVDELTITAPHGPMRAHVARLDNKPRPAVIMLTGVYGFDDEIKRMAEAFYGRVAAYEEGLAGDDSVLLAALARNLFGTAPPNPALLQAMAGYMRREAARLNEEGAEELLAGRLSFGGPPRAAATPGPAGDT